jgi:L-lactate dehydrogenase (cytochrome)
MRNTSQITFDPRYPSVADLRRRASSRIPRFAFEYLDRGCNQEVNLERNRTDLQEVVLSPSYLKAYHGPDLETDLFGQKFAAPFGMAPIGLQGLIWPGAPEILASVAHLYRLPFILSTVSTASIERISELTEGSAWFQFYHPAEDAIRDDLLDRAEACGCKTLVLLCDTPTFGFRPSEIKNGLSMPPRMELRNLLQMMGKPAWLLETLKRGSPRFANLIPYMPSRMKLSQLGRFMDGFFDKRMTPDKIAYIRDRWKGNLVLKGIGTPEDAEIALRLGLDGIVVSNHGGRQLDAGPSSIAALRQIAPLYGESMTILMDSGVRSGPDIARALACGARTALLGRAFMYGVGALGAKGGPHTVELLLTELRQVMSQLGCESVVELPGHLQENRTI